MSEIWSDAEEEEEFMDTSDSTAPPDAEREAEAAKAAGNTCYQKKDYYTAITHYTNAINLTPEKAAYYGNRSAAYMMVKNFTAALDDAQKSVDKDPAFFKGSLRIIKCYIAMGNLVAASRALEDLKSRDSSTTYAGETTNITRLREFEAKAEKDWNRNEYRQVVYILDRALEVAPACTRYKTQRAECLALLGRYAEAQEATNDLLRNNSLDAGPLYVKGLCLFYQDQLDKARQHFLQVLRVDPDHSKARRAIKDVKSLEQTKQQGNEAFQGGRNDDALRLYREALQICPNNKLTNAKLQANLAAVYMKQKNYKDALKACNAAIELDDNYIKAYARRISCYQELDQHEEAVRDAETLHKMERTRESKNRVRDAQLKMKKAKRKDYYKILGITQSAGEDEIKKAYKKSALKHHPDRHASKDDEEKAEEEKKFKEVGEAYSVLSDPQKKMRYDNGEDLDDPMGGMGHADATEIFQTFFGGGAGGPQFSFGGGGFPGGHHGGGGQQYTFRF